MRVLGLVVEYNPFHRGHLYHVEEARKACHPDLVVAMMSGHFTQRGETAIVDKWARAEMALRCGVDVVFELPVAWALRSARDFAHGAVHHLHMLGATHLCFGSESGDIQALSMIADSLLNESEAFRHELKHRLREGQPYARARARAIQKTLFPTSDAPLIVESNDILGTEYLVALKGLRSSIIPFTIKRQGASYHDPYLTSPLASATAIRQALLQGLSTSSLPIPSATQDILARELQAGRGPVKMDSFLPVIIHLMRTMTIEELEGLPDMEAGLAYRLKHAARKSTELEAMLSMLKTKRYTWTRFQRILCYLILRLTQRRLKEIHAIGPSYLRLLGLKKSRSSILGNLDTLLPIISSPARTRGNLSLLLDALATDVYVLGYPDKEMRTGGQDLTRPPVLLE